MAAQFLGTATLQETIQLAVRELLDRMHEVEGFADALRSAERARQSQAGVRSLPSSEGRDEPLSDGS